VETAGTAVPRQSRAVIDLTTSVAGSRSLIDDLAREVAADTDLPLSVSRTWVARVWSLAQASALRDRGLG
jgi:hypothetical protein